MIAGPEAEALCIANATHASEQSSVRYWSEETNEKLTSEVNELKMQLERVAFESKEAAISMDGLKEANSELTSEPA